MHIRGSTRRSVVADLGDVCGLVALPATLDAHPRISG
jgi:hypothetical protein